MWLVLVVARGRVGLTQVKQSTQMTWDQRTPADDDRNEKAQLKREEGMRPAVVMFTGVVLSAYDKEKRGIKRWSISTRAKTLLKKPFRRAACALQTPDGQWFKASYLPNGTSSWGVA